MAPHLSQQMRDRIVVWFDEQDKTADEIATLAGCCVRTVYNILELHRDFGTTKNPYSRRNQGRTRILNMGDMAYLMALVQAKPKVYLDELQEELAFNRNVDVSISTLSRSLRHWELTNKQVASAALERNEMLRATWEAEHGDIPAEYCVWLDEASVDDKTNQRSNGWSPLGQACVCQETFIRGQRYSVLPALTSEGIIALDIFEGSVNKERFLQFIKDQVVCLHLIMIPVQIRV
jgi:transposase